MGWVIFRFVLIGPAIGSFAFAFTPILFGFWFNSASDFAGMIQMGLYGLIFAYPLAALPAGLSGFLYWLALKKRRRNIDPVVRPLLGGIIGGLCGLVFGRLLPTTETHLLALKAWASAGVVGGAVSALSIGNGLFERVIRVQTAEGEA